VDVLEIIGLAAAAFAAGAVNAVAGGGSNISFPALLAFGYDAKPANVTNTVALWPGYFGGSVAYRDELRRQRTRAVLLLVPSIVGALAGSVLLLSTSADTFEAIVPFLILLGSGIMFFQEPLARAAERRQLSSRGGDHVPIALMLMVFAGAVYGAYFGAGLGVILLAGLTILLPDDIQHSNALKGLLSMVINAVAVVWFAAFGPVEWVPAFVMAGGALAGGYLGVGVARMLGAVWLRRAVIGFGVVVAVILLVT
jgi:uncharacterized membrane protein YfcA